MLFSYIVIPYDDTIPLKLHTIESSSSCSSIVESEIQHHFLSDVNNNSEKDFRHDDDDDDDDNDDISDNIISTLLIRSRPRQRNTRGRRCHHSLNDCNNNS